MYNVPRTKEFKEFLKKRHKGKNYSPRTQWTKDTFPSQKNVKRTKETKLKISLSKIGNIPWNKGLTKDMDKRISGGRPKNKT